MYPVHDVDALLLLAVSLAAKRRPAELTEIIAANDLILGSVSAEAELAGAFHQLSTQGLIVQLGDGYAPTSDALNLLSAGRKKADNEERLTGLKTSLSDHIARGEHPAILVTVEQLSAAIVEHQANKAHAGRNLFVPKPKPVVDTKRPQHRKPFPSRRKY